MALNLNNNIGEIYTKDLLQTKSTPNTNSSNDNSINFGDMLKQELESTNETLQTAHKAEIEIATGTVKDLAKANIAIEKADIQMQMMLEVRNKAINAYKELSKIQI